mmetsp:Transcript_4567/g.13321  ORF Transcript_4567/g.13321 Transcript_4567/m.13321 type:complete len:217 (-) Transcript_4567:3-653(-)
MPSVLHSSRFSSTCLDARQFSTSLSTFPPSTLTQRCSSSTCPLPRRRVAPGAELSSSFVPGGRCTPRSFTAPYSMARNFCSPSVMSSARRRHFPPSKSSWNFVGWVTSANLETCTKYLPGGISFRPPLAKSFGSLEARPNLRMSVSRRYSSTCFWLRDSAPASSSCLPASRISMPHAASSAASPPPPAILSGGAGRGPRAGPWPGEPGAALSAGVA